MSLSVSKEEHIDVDAVNNTAKGKRTGREIRKKEKKKGEKKCRGLLCGNDTENGSDDGDSIKKSRRREGGRS